MSSTARVTFFIFFIFFVLGGGQLLQRLGRTEEAKVEMETVTRMMNNLRGKRQQELYEGTLPNPEVTAEPK